ncbi:NACHT domain-containing protein [Kitasatospora sp. NPDC057692]|uniref:NACHT domain-containing protein n=1 Tax=Kitasatospora sp. NPDC057692 TaxID=3346215 RepID=UPI0036995ACD
MLQPAWSRTPTLPERIALLSLVVALVSLVVGLLGLRRPVERNTANQSRGWAAELADQVKQAESRQRGQLLGGDTHRINLTFTLRAAPARAAQAPGEGRLFDGTPTVPDVAAYWRGTRPRRLVVTGAAGSGKTVLALELMLALIKGRDADDPVPVRLSLASWDTRVPLSDLLVRRLVEAYGWPAGTAADLVRYHRVLPVLDGLDEMDPTLPDGTPAPNALRALEVLRALNSYQEGGEAGPLVLTCRTAHYDALATRARLIDAARIEIDAVPAADAHTYLSQRALDRDRWQPVLDALRDDPTGSLATTLSTPWRLCLAATVYARDHDPADLLAHTTPDAHLLARFIPATTTLHPAPYSAADTHRWLARLAHHLATNPVAGAPAGPGTDLALHQLWSMAGAARVKWVDAALTALVVLSPIVLTAELIGMSEGPVARIVTVCVYAAVAALTAFLTARSRTDRPAGTDLAALRTASGRRHVRKALLTGVLAGAACAALIISLLSFALGEEPDYGASAVLVSWAAVVGAAVGLTRGIASVLRVRPAAAVAPRRVIRGELVLGAMLALVAGLTVMIGYSLVYTAYDYLAYPPSAGYEPDSIVNTALVGLVLGSFAGFVVWLSRSGARRYLVFILCSRGQLPRRLGAFLDHCCDAGLMRMSGTSYQFRHRELQHWLAAHPNPPAGSTDPLDTPPRDA